MQSKCYVHKLDNGFLLDPIYFPTNLEFFNEIPSWFGKVDDELDLMIPEDWSLGIGGLQDPTQKDPTYYFILDIHKTNQKLKPLSRKTWRYTKRRKSVKILNVYLLKVKEFNAFFV